MACMIAMWTGVTGTFMLSCGAMVPRIILCARLYFLIGPLLGAAPHQKGAGKWKDDFPPPHRISIEIRLVSCSAPFNFLLKFLSVGADDVKLEWELVLLSFV